MNDTADQLAALRRQIDRIDDSLMSLLVERTQIVEQVGALKHRTAPGICPIRPGREATMIRRIVQHFTGTSFLPAAAATIWRTIIGMSTSVEASLRISAFAPDNARDLYWLAREYFGPFAPVARQPQLRRVIGDVTDGRTAVGILPMPRSGDAERWWNGLLGRNGGDMPKIFARVPFVENGERNTPCGLAIAKIAPEETGDDISLLVIDTDGNTSQHRLQTAFAAAKLEASWIDIYNPRPEVRLHLVEVKGFLPDEHPTMRTLAASLGNACKIEFIGAYAVPVIVTESSNAAETA